MTEPLLTHTQIADRIPHAGDMVLLSAVLSSGPQVLVATAELSGESPLAMNGRLGSETLLEYAGQCMAIHGALATDTGDARLAFVSQVKSLTWAAPVLPVTTAVITVTQQGETASGAIYQFDARDNQSNACLGSGVISIMFSPDAR